MTAATITKRTTRTKHKRVPFDAYYTHDRLTEALLDEVTIAGRVLEPCCGESGMVRVLERGSGRTVIGSDIQQPQAGVPVDATTAEFWEYHKAQGIDWTVTNPPFNKAPVIIPQAYEASQIGIAMLLNTTYSEPCKNRAQWLKAHADNLVFKMDINPRPRFRADTNNSAPTTVAWFVWRKDFSWKALGVPSPFRYLEKWKDQ